MLIIELLLTALFLVQSVDAQQVVADTNPYATPTPPPQPQTPPPAQTPVLPQQQPQQYVIPQQVPQQTYVQQQPVNAGGSSVDLGTLMTILTPVLGGISAIFIKNRKDMEKKDEEVKKTTEQQIQSVLKQLYPALQANAAVAQQTAKQDVKLSEVTNLLYKVMGEKANEIQGLPEIQQVNLLKDAIQSEMIAKQYQQTVNKVTPATAATTKTETTDTNPYSS